MDVERMKSFPVNWRLFLLVVTFMLLLGGAGFRLITIDTDITRFLPQNDRVISDAAYIFRNHPIQDRLVIDMATPKNAPDLLVQAADRVEQRLRESGLFKQVGTKDMQEIFPGSPGTHHGKPSHSLHRTRSPKCSKTAFDATR